MSSIGVAVVGLVFLAMVGLAISGLVILRKLGLHSRRMAAEQAQLNEKSSVTRPTKKAGEPGGGYRFSFGLGYVWGWIPWILLLATLAMILWFLLKSGVSTSTVDKGLSDVASSWIQDVGGWLESPPF